MDRAPGAASPGRVIVAVVLTWRGRIGLFKRSALVHGDAGRWHCLTGYLDEGEDPVGQALLELREETGLTEVDLRAGPLLVLDDDAGTPWHVHTFLAVTTQRRLDLNWEHDHYRWVLPRAVSAFDGRVAWLTDVLEAVREVGDSTAPGRAPVAAAAAHLRERDPSRP